MSKTPKEADVTIGRNIRVLRIARSMSQEKLAAALGITFQQVQKYEKGTNRVGGSRLIQIANALQVAPAELLVGTEIDSPRKELPSFSAESPQEARLLTAYRGLPQHMRPAVLGLVEAAGGVA